MLAAPGVVHSQSPLPSGTAACLARLQQARTGGASRDASARLAKVCPDVAAALAASSWGATLTQGELPNLTAGSFRQLVDLARHYRRAPAASRNLSAAKLGEIVARLEPFGPVPTRSLWDRILAKVRHWLGLDRGDSGRFATWLRRFSIPAGARRVLVYALGFVLVAAALAVLLNELRHGGVLTGRSRRRRAVPTGFDRATASPVSAATFDDVRRAPPARQPIMLFALLVGRLRARHAGLVRASVTHRELAAAVRRQRLDFAAPLAAVAAAAEGVTFGEQLPDGAQLELLLSAGETVLRELADEPEPAP